MKNLVVRRARTFDLQQIVSIAQRTWAAAWTLKAYQEELKRLDSTFLVCDDGKVLGYIVARLVDQDMQLLDFAVLNDGHGVGQHLWRQLLIEAKTKGSKKVSFEVSSSNSRAKHFYLRAGAAVVGRRLKFYNDGSDAILMDRII